MSSETLSKVAHLALHHTFTYRGTYNIFLDWSWYFKFTVLAAVSSADDRWDAAGWPCQRESVCQAAGGVADRDGASAKAASELLGAGQGHCRGPRDDERVEIQSDLESKGFRRQGLKIIPYNDQPMIVRILK